MKTSSLILIIFIVSVSNFSCKKETETLIIPPENEVTVSLLPLAIFSSTCILKGETLIVYAPNTPDFETYNTENHTVTWKRSGVQVGSNYSINCVCDGNYTVEVTDVITGNTGQMEYIVQGCEKELSG